MEKVSLGLKVTISSNSEYFGDYLGINLYITGLKYESDGKTINITLGQTSDEQESDGWRMSDLDLA